MKDIKQGFHVIKLFFKSDIFKKSYSSITDFSNLLSHMTPRQKLDRFRALALPNKLVSSIA